MKSKDKTIMRVIKDISVTFQLWMIPSYLEVEESFFNARFATQFFHPDILYSQSFSTSRIVTFPIFVIKGAN